MDHLRFSVSIGAAIGALVLQVAAVAAPPAPAEAQVLDAVRELLAERAANEGWVEPQYALRLQRMRNGWPPCDRPLAIEPVDTRLLGRLRVAVRCPAPEGWEQTVSVRASVTARVTVAASPVPAGRALEDADLAVERRDITTVRDAISDPAEAAGQSSRRPLRSGDVLRSTWLTAPVLVRRGDAVRIVARRDGITVTVAGEAQEAGARGAVVRVRNSGNGRIIRARVVDAGTVQPVDL
jgi:flagella basal body P-ring formation protein FlgA